MPSARTLRARGMDEGGRVTEESVPCVDARLTVLSPHASIPNASRRCRRTHPRMVRCVV